MIEFAFFFALLIGAAYVVWLLIAPFAAPIALAAIIVTICYPLYIKVLRATPKQNRSLASLISVLLVVLVIVLPLALLGSFILREAVSVYSLVNAAADTSFSSYLTRAESFIQTFIPSFSLDVAGVVEQAANFIATHLVSIFAGTASTIFFFFLTLIASFYFFRDGKEFTAHLVKMSPLKDGQDTLILKRLASAVRSVATGTVLVALIQGVLTAIGLSLFGFERAVLWGSVAAIGALIPGIGTTIVFLPAVIYLIMTGSHLTAAGVALWGVLAVGLIDNVLGPYLMSRGNTLHPFLILLSVLGGIALMGPVGFILGPVFLSLFMVLLEHYASYVKSES